MTYRVVIEEDTEFDPWDPECHEDIIRDFDAGNVFAYNVILECLSGCGHCGQSRWDEVDSVCGTLLDSPDWAGVYSLEQLDLRSPGPDANHLNELVNQMIGRRT